MKTINPGRGPTQPDAPIVELVAELEIARERLGLPRPVDPALFEPLHVGAAHVECGPDGELFYIVTERGLTLEKKQAHDLQEMLYWLMQDLTFGMACTHEFRNRKDNSDCRRVIFCVQLELLSRVSQVLRDRRAAEIEAILAANPFVDR